MCLISLRLSEVVKSQCGHENDVLPRCGEDATGAEGVTSSLESEVVWVSSSFLCAASATVSFKASFFSEQHGHLLCLRHTETIANIIKMIENATISSAQCVTSEKRRIDARMESAAESAAMGSVHIHTRRWKSRADKIELWKELSSSGITRAARNVPKQTPHYGEVSGKVINFIRKRKRKRKRKQCNCHTLAILSVALLTAATSRCLVMFAANCMLLFART